MHKIKYQSVKTNTGGFIDPSLGRTAIAVFLKKKFVVQLVFAQTILFGSLFVPSLLAVGSVVMENSIGWL